MDQASFQKGYRIHNKSLGPISQILVFQMTKSVEFSIGKWPTTVDNPPDMYRDTPNCFIVVFLWVFWKLASTSREIT